MLDAIGTLNVARPQLVVDVIGNPAAVYSAEEDGAAHRVAAVLHDAVQIDAAAGPIGGNRRRDDTDLRLQHVIEVTLRGAFIALNRHAFDELLAVDAAQPVCAKTDLLGHVRPAAVG